ncbi:MAG: biotin--[acetyl-CoA-carboxylase] ligase [Legionellales bacterium]|jgi:BirA family transcriptional regulator, biotin operon repressor / biotin---[acetyl-CoA-carboxylase] ligase|nr:biotin--[acetyl-CoA-carboxylase] ligase [Legionellales bacterium]
MSYKQEIALNPQTIISLIAAPNIKKIYSIEVLNSIDSTNRYLAEKYSEDPKTLAICLAEQQIHGKGTQNKIWSSPNKKGIYLSFTWQVSNKMLTTAPISITIGAAIASLLNKYQPEYNIELKWPNDLYANGKKLGGILIEIYAQTQDIWHVIVGIGINIHSDESITATNKVSLADITGNKLDRNQVTAAIMNECISFLEDTNDNGLTNIIKVWNKHDMLHNKPISIISANKKYEGVNLGICTLGKLNILIQNRIIKFSEAKIIEY